MLSASLKGCAGPALAYEAAHTLPDTRFIAAAHVRRSAGHKGIHVMAHLQAAAMWATTMCARAEGFECRLAQACCARDCCPVGTQANGEADASRLIRCASEEAWCVSALQRAQLAGRNLAQRRFCQSHKFESQSAWPGPETRPSTTCQMPILKQQTALRPETSQSVAAQAHAQQGPDADTQTAAGTHLAQCPCWPTPHFSPHCCRTHLRHCCLRLMKSRRHSPAPESPAQQHPSAPLESPRPPPAASPSPAVVRSRRPALAQS